MIKLRIVLFCVAIALSAAPLASAGVLNGDTFSGVVFNDLTGSGAYAAGDPGLAGWTVDLLSGSNVLASTVSSSIGTYAFVNTAPGTYTIELINQAGWIDTLPTGPGYTVSASSSSLNFGEFQLVSVSGSAYNDLNGNGLQDAGEPPQSGWSIELLSGSSVVASTVSDASGSYLFAGLGPGSYTLQEEGQPGWTQTEPGSPGHYSFTANSGVNLTGDAFGNHYSTVPEPASLMLLVGGLLGFTGMIRRHATR